MKKQIIKTTITFLLVLLVNISYSQNGNVGIGTITPNTKLEVFGITRITADQGYLQLGRINSGDNFGYISSGGQSNGTGLKFETTNGPGVNTGATRMTILNNGNVGVGITNPSTSLETFGEVRARDRLSVITGDNEGLFADDGVGSTIFSISRRPGNEVRFQAYGYHTFYSGGSSGTEKMRIDGNGNVGIGTTSPDGQLKIENLTYSTTPSLKIHRETYDGMFCNGAPLMLEFTTQCSFPASNPVFTVSFGGTAQAWAFVPFSDSTLKSNILTMGNCLQDVLALRPVTYNWKNQIIGNATQIGLIAQEVQSIIPEVVHTSADSLMGINYNALVPVLIRSIQEQQEIINNLEIRLQALENQ